ncbi:MAG TPA: hypothetical protein VF251_01530 [Pyrinomonadaceae bacterium]
MQRNKSATAFTCDNSTGGGGGGIASYAGGSSGTSFSSHRSESVGCRLTNESFDEGALFSALKADVERTLQDTGAHITDRGSSGPANFFLNYVVKNIQGHIELKGTRIGNGYYDVNALLEEKSN